MPYLGLIPFLQVAKDPDMYKAHLCQCPIPGSYHFYTMKKMVAKMMMAVCQCPIPGSYHFYGPPSKPLQNAVFPATILGGISQNILIINVFSAKNGMLTIYSYLSAFILSHLLLKNNPKFVCRNLHSIEIDKGNQDRQSGLTESQGYRCHSPKERSRAASGFPCRVSWISISSF